MGIKIRLYRGPFDGKVLKDQPSNYHLMVVDKKRMSRKQQWEYRKRVADNWHFAGNTLDGGSLFISAPYIQAEYARTRFEHPDGSVFYEWTGYSQPYGPQ